MHALQTWTGAFCFMHFLQGPCTQHLNNAPQSGLYRKKMPEQSADALSLKDVKHGLENSQFTAKKPTSGKSDVWESFSFFIDTDGKKIPFLL
ncbi:MAG: hypothetical protein ACRC7H_06540 [Plesiomonas shigelloides]